MDEADYLDSLALLELCAVSKRRFARQRSSSIRFLRITWDFDALAGAWIRPALYCACLIVDAKKVLA